MCGVCVRVCTLYMYLCSMCAYVCKGVYISLMNAYAMYVLVIIIVMNLTR